MQYEGDMRPVSTQGGQLDQGTLKDIQDHLKVSEIWPITRTWTVEKKEPSLFLKL